MTCGSRVETYRDEGNSTLYIQKKVVISGRDLGVVFLGGRYLGSYARVAGDGAWNTTIHHGGRYEAYEAGDDIIELARAAQAPFGLSFTSVDVALTEEGPVVFEVSTFGGFRGMKDGLGQDAASMYADFVLEDLCRG